MLHIMATNFMGYQRTDTNITFNIHITVLITHIAVYFERIFLNFPTKTGKDGWPNNATRCNHVFWTHTLYPYA